MRGPRARRAWLALLPLAGALLLAPPAARAQDERDALVKIKTAYLYNFMKFVRWPPRPEAEAAPGPAADAPAATAPLLLCVLNDPRMAEFAGEALRGKQVAGQPVQVAAVGPGQDSSPCAMVYVAAHQALPPPAAGVLTVGEGRAFVDAGGMIGFTVVQDRVRFLVNLRALKQAELSADAQLLSVALEVRQ